MEYKSETKILEFKREYSKTILKTICAYANFHDGRIVIGINDSGKIVGVDNIDELKLSIENSINDSIIPSPYYEFDIDILDGMSVLIIKVFRGNYTPYMFQGKSYMRRDTATIQTDAITTQNLILYGRNLEYGDLTSKEQELSFSYIEFLLKKQYQVQLLTDDMMKTLGLLKGDEYNNTAALLSDENPIGTSVIQLVAFTNSGVSRIKDRKELKNMSVLKQYEACMSFYDKHINIGEIIEGPYSRTVEDVPLIAYREAIANMIVHRDYSLNIDARVEFFTDRIEIISPGGLPLGMLNDEFKNGVLSNPRNRTLTDIFLRLKIIERLATGIRRIKEQYLHQKSKPNFKVSQNAVIVVLPYVQEVLGNSHKLIDEMEIRLNGVESVVHKLIKDNPMIKRIDIQKNIGLEKTQTVEILKKLRLDGWIIKSGNGPATGYKILK